jgi:hypothetical protein
MHTESLQSTTKTMKGKGRWDFYPIDRSDREGDRKSCSLFAHLIAVRTLQEMLGGAHPTNVQNLAVSYAIQPVKISIALATRSFDRGSGWKANLPE